MLDLSNSMTAAVEKAGKSIVLVNARNRFPASGVVTAAGMILTANHVVERDEDISVVLPDGTQAAASLAGRDPSTDLAVLRVEGSATTPAERSAAAKVGQLVLAVGRPTTSGMEASLGVLSAISAHHGMLEYFYRSDTTPYPGFSGGALIDAEGNVLGINTSGFGRGAAITIPAELAWKVAVELANNGSIRRGYLGIRSQQVELTPAAQAAIGRQQGAGLLIVGLEKDSPAEKGNMLVGDTLVGVNGNPVSDHEELFANLSGNVIGVSSAIEILRGGAYQSIAVVIEERKPETEEHDHHHHHAGHRHGRR